MAHGARGAVRTLQSPHTTAHQTHTLETINIDQRTVCVTQFNTSRVVPTRDDEPPSPVCAASMCLSTCRARTLRARTRHARDRRWQGEGRLPGKRHAPSPSPGPAVIPCAVCLRVPYSPPGLLPPPPTLPLSTYKNTDAPWRGVSPPLIVEACTRRLGMARRPTTSRRFAQLWPPSLEATRHTSPLPSRPLTHSTRHAARHIAPFALVLPTRACAAPPSPITLPPLYVRARDARRARPLGAARARRRRRASSALRLYAMMSAARAVLPISPGADGPTHRGRPLELLGGGKRPLARPLGDDKRGPV